MEKSHDTCDGAPTAVFEQLDTEINYDSYGLFRRRLLNVQVRR